MSSEHHTSHMAPGFGKNTNGLGLFIIAAIFVLIGLFAWWLWNNNNKYYKHYRVESSASAGHGHSKPEAPKETSGPAILGQLDTVSGNFIYHVGDEIEIKLPDGTILKVGENSTEAKLIRFLTDEKVAVDTVDKTKGWITCDRIYFETGYYDLTAESKRQIYNLGSILKAFPNAEIKVGGYTDNTGGADVNTKLSGERAMVVANGLKTISGRKEIASEGYGPLHPISTNDTDEGRALNRRVDVRVTKK